MVIDGSFHIIKDTYGLDEGKTIVSENRCQNDRHNADKLYHPCAPLQIILIEQNAVCWHTDKQNADNIFALRHRKRQAHFVSHELKTPLTSMKVLADSLNGQENVPVELYKEFMADINML